MRSGLLLAALLLAGGPPPPSPIVIRHDRDDGAYRALGARFPMVGLVVPDGEGTLVAPTWVLTAAHVARDVAHRRTRQVRFGTTAYEITGVYLHPDWQDGGPHDLALLQLARPIAGILPADLYPDRDEAGQLVTFVGRGDTGTGQTGPTRRDGLLRGATNRVDAADDAWLYFTFDAPPAATDLEGISGPGDSGGPALIERGERVFVAGISVWGSPGEQGRGTYGAKEGYTRVSSYRDWIRERMEAGTR
jgi:hypothetical protein